MKRFVYLVFIGFVVAGCSKQDDKVSPSGKPVIYTVNYPLAYFAERIAGQLVDVHFPEMDGDPAFWNPSPDEIVEYQNADLILLNGAGYAKWVPKVSLPPARLVDTSAIVSDRYIPLKGAETHAHGPNGAHAHGDVAFTIWLDPQLAIQQAATIRDAFTRRWGDHAAEFESGFRSLEKDLLSLDADLEKGFTTLGKQPLVGSHPVYQYLTRRYNLNLESVHWEPDEAPDEILWRALEDILKAHPARIMLWEGAPMVESKTKLAEKGIQSIVFDPCGNRPESGDFLSVMQNNVSELDASGK
jgi:zinc transport system substrate-binding protein